MNRKKYLITYLVLLVIVAAVVLATVSFQRSSKGSGTAQLMQYLSDGFFTVSVLYIGCSVLMFIQEAGNFYGLQYLFHTLIRLFSSNKERFTDKKDYFTYCQEKKERQAVEGKSPLKMAMFLVGLGCFALAVLFTVAFYQVS